MVDLKAKPFYLDERAVQWVETTLNNMSLDEKLGQVFIQLAQPDKDYLDEKILGKHVGGILFAKMKQKWYKKPCATFKNRQKFLCYFAVI